jgi:lysophospholipase L1-like esterase
MLWRLDLNALVKKTTSILRQQLLLSDRNTICYSPFVGHHGRPNGNYGTTAEHLDRDGFPNVSPPEMPKSEARRVFVLGDSTIYNGDGSLDTTIPARIQNLLHERGELGVRLYNYSIPGCTFHQPLALINSLLMDYEPDEILINIGGVDSVIHKNYDPRPGYPMWGFLFELAQEQRQRTSADADYSQRDDWRDLTERWLDMRHAAGSDLGDGFCERVADEFRLALNRLGRFADAFDIPVSVTLQPISQTRRAPSSEEGRLASAKALDLISRQYQAFQKVAFPDQSRLTQWSARMRVIDITDVFDDYEGTIYTDHVHYNAVGRELMAARFIRVLDGGV